MVVTVTGSLFEDTEDIMGTSMAYYLYHGNEWFKYMQK